MYKKFLGEGIYGKCYELKSGEVLKIFKIPRDIDDLKKYKRFLEYKNDSVLFPYRFNIEKRHIKSYICAKAPGDKIYNSLAQYDIFNISKHLFKLERDIGFISNGNIIMYDNHSENMFYDGVKFSVIDVDEYDFYDYVYKHDLAYVYDRNMSKIETCMYEIFCNEISKTELSNNDKHVIYDQFKKYIFWDCNPSSQILIYKNILEKFLNENITSLDSVKVLTKR